MNKQASIKKNFIMNCILTLSTMIVPVIVFPYVTRILLPEGIGKVSFATSVVNYFLIIVQLGIPTYGIRAVAEVRDDKIALSQRVEEILLINLFTCFVGYIFFVLFLLLGVENYETRFLYCILGTRLLTDSLGVEWLYKGLEQYSYMTVRTLIFKTVSVLGIFLFVKEKQDYLLYAFFTVLASAAPCICNFIIMHKYVDRVKVKMLAIKKHLKSIAYFLSMSVAITVYTNLDNIMLGIITDDTQVGYYSTVVKIRSLLLSIVTALGGVLLPRTSYYVEKGLYDNFYRVCRKAFHFVCLLAVPITVFVILAADLCVYILAGKDFLPASNALRWIMPTVILVGVSNLVGIQMLVPLHKEKIAFQSVLYGAIIDFILNIFLIPNFKASGAAIATMIAEATVLIVQIKVFEKNILKELFCLKWKNIFLSVLFSALSCIAILCLIKNAYICFVAASTIYAAVYILSLFWQKDEIMVEIVEGIVNSWREKIR